VFRETTPRSRTFVSLGTQLPDADFNEFGASFLKISPDGDRIAMGNNGGTSFDHCEGVPERGLARSAPRWPAGRLRGARHPHRHVGGGDFFGGGDINFAAFISKAAVKSALRGNGPVDTGDPSQVRKVDPDPAPASAYNVVVNREREEIYLSPGSHAFVFRAR
jgi:hypothetical protein